MRPRYPPRALPVRPRPRRTGGADCAPRAERRHRPTLLSLAGLPTSASFEGQSFAPLLGGGAASPTRPSRAAWGTIFDDSQNYVTEGEWKLVRWNSPGVRTADELYHLASDPGETYDYAREHRDVAARMAGPLDRWLAAKASDQPWRPWETP